MFNRLESIPEWYLSVKTRVRLLLKKLQQTEPKDSFMLLFHQ